MSILASIIAVHYALRYIYPKPPPNLKPSLCITCIQMEATNVYMCFIVVVLGLMVVLDIRTLEYSKFLDYTHNEYIQNFMLVKVLNEGTNHIEPISFISSITTNGA